VPGRGGKRDDGGRLDARRDKRLPGGGVLGHVARGERRDEP
jgi:hypothetical protein